MPYQIYQSDGTPITIADGAVDTQFYNATGGGGVGGSGHGQGIQLIGQNTVGYGAPIAQTFLQLTENFCSSSQPYPALQGQLWFNQINSTTGNLYVRVTNTASSLISNWNQVITADSSGNVTIPGTITAGSFSGTATAIAGGLANEIVYQTGAGATSFITAPSVASTYLEWNGSAFVWGTVTVTNANTITAANQIANVVYDIPFLSAATGNVSIYSNSAISFNPSTGTLLSTNFSGSNLSVSTLETTSIFSSSNLSIGATNIITINPTTLSLAPSSLVVSVSGGLTATGVIAGASFNGAGTGLTGTAASLSIGGTATTSTNLAGGVGGSIPYQSAAGTTTMLANGTAGQVLTSQGGTSAPQWANALPPGMIMDFAGTVAPSGWLACPLVATNISRTTYAALFAAIGTTWGIGDGSTTFGMPYFPADYTAVQANSNVGTSTVGQVIAHTHSGVVIPSGGGLAQGGTLYSSGTTGSTGGSANLAAGIRIMRCVKI